MKAIIFSNRKTAVSSRVEQILTSLVSAQELLVLRSYKDLDQSLCQYALDLHLVVLLIDNQSTMQGILSLKQGLIDRQIVIIVDQNHPGIIANAHKLYPRFLCLSSEWELMNLWDVFRKMISKSENTQINGHKRYMNGISN